MKTTHIIAILVVSAVTITAASAHADDGKARRNQARALWRAGTARFNVQKFDEAIKLYEQAYETAPELSGILFNIAQTYRQKKNYERALFYFHAYLRETPNANDREEVEERIADLETLLKAQTESGKKPPDGMRQPDETEVAPGAVQFDAVDAERKRPSAPWHRNWGWWSVGSGVVIAGVSLPLFVTAAGLDDDAQRQPVQTTRAQFRQVASLRRNLGAAFAVAGGALVVAGVVKIAILNSPASVGNGASVDVALAPGWIGLSGSF